MALATAAVLASASGSAAFSPSPATSLTSRYTAQQTPIPNNGKQRSSQRPMPVHVSSMVSFLDAPVTTGRMQPKGKRGLARTKGRIRKGPTKERRTIEIDLQPEYEFLGLGLDDLEAPIPSKLDGIGSAIEHYDSELDLPAPVKRQPPAIDSEILYEGITSSPPKHSKLDKVDAGATMSNSPEDKATTFAVNAVSTDRTPVVRSMSVTKGTSTKKAVVLAKPKKENTKSSTMPGFIKDEELDKHIAQLGLNRLPSSASMNRRRSRLSKSAARLRRRAANSESMYRKSSTVPDSLRDYAHEIHSVARITPKEEKELGTKTQEAIRLQGLQEELRSKYGRDPTDNEWCAAAGKVNAVALQEAIEDGMRAKNTLVASNLRMVQRVVNVYIRNGLGSEYNAGDLMQDGTMALIRAAEKYEPDRGFRFSTYAMYWIRSAVKRSQTSQSRIVTVPQRIHETHKRMSKEEARLKKELSAEGREPTKEELAEACDISVLQLDRCRKAMGQVTFSLDAEVQNQHKPNSASSRRDTMYDIVEGRVDETEYERTQRLLMKEHLIVTLKQYLSPHEVDLLLLRYGLMDERALPRGMYGPLTIAEVSKLVGLKPDKVRRIIINSQKQLQHVMKEWENFEYELA